MVSYLEVQDLKCLSFFLYFSKTLCFTIHHLQMLIMKLDLVPRTSRLSDDEKVVKWSSPRAI